MADPYAFTREEIRAMVGDIQDYFSAELDQQIGSIPAELLMRFFADRIGPYFYNRGVADSKAMVAARIEDIDDGFYGLAKKTRATR